MEKSDYPTIVRIPVSLVDQLNNLVLVVRKKYPTFIEGLPKRMRPEVAVLRMAMARGIEEITKELEFTEH